MLTNRQLSICPILIIQISGEKKVLNNSILHEDLVMCLNEVKNKWMIGIL